MARIVRDGTVKYVSGPGRIALLTEPYCLHPEDYFCAAGGDFDMVLTHHTRFTEMYQNWYYYPHGGTFIDEQDRAIHNKTKLMSTFISEKDSMPGHKLRRLVYPEIRLKLGVDVFGVYVAKKLERKINGMRDYYYHLAIESCQERGYFTEKIIDCFLTGTIPIYWGDPDIGNIFNTDGIIIWDGSPQKLVKIIEGLDVPLTEYQHEAMVENFETAKRYIDYRKTISRLYPGLQL